MVDLAKKRGKHIRKPIDMIQRDRDREVLNNMNSRKCIVNPFCIVAFPYDFWTWNTI